MRTTEIACPMLGSALFHASGVRSVAGLHGRIALVRCSILHRCRSFAVKSRHPQRALTRGTDGGSNRVEQRNTSTPPPCWTGREVISALRNAHEGTLTRGTDGGSN